MHKWIGAKEMSIISIKRRVIADRITNKNSIYSSFSTEEKDFIALISVFDVYKRYCGFIFSPARSFKFNENWGGTNASKRFN